MSPSTYEDAGVSLKAADEAVERLRAHVRSTSRPEVLSDIGGFAGLFAFEPGRWEKPVLVSTTDGVGTKSEVARQVGRYDTIGIDCVAMSVDDLAVCGAEPLFFLDYISIGVNEPAIVEELVAGVAEGCRQAGCALMGGEISEHPGVMQHLGQFDLVGFAVGVVEADGRLPRGVRPGDAVIGLASPGLRSNGYSLARAVFQGRSMKDAAWDGAERTLGDELLVPSVIYSPAMRHLTEAVEVRAFAHVTGGGIPGNLARVLPAGVGAVLRRGSWPEPRIFAEIQAAGDVAEEEMERVFNLGLGMLAVVGAADADLAIETLGAAGNAAYKVGEVVQGGAVRVISG